MFLIFILYAVSANASAKPALFYSDTNAVKSNRSTIGWLQEEGFVLTSRDPALLSTSCYIGSLDKILYHGVLSQFDGDLGISVYKTVSVVNDPSLQSIFESHVQKILFVLDSQNGSSRPVIPMPQVEPRAFEIKIDGRDPMTEKVQIVKKRREATCELSIVRLSTIPVWGVSIRLEASPKMSFWKKQRAQDLTDVPRPVFKYDHQAIFNPMKKGTKMLVLPLNLYFIEQEDYVWTMTLTTKTEKSEYRFPITFLNPI